MILFAARRIARRNRHGRVEVLHHQRVLDFRGELEQPDRVFLRGLGARHLRRAELLKDAIDRGPCRRGRRGTFRHGLSTLPGRAVTRVLPLDGDSPSGHVERSCLPRRGSTHSARGLPKETDAPEDFSRLPSRA